jgi:uncharacterized protein (DUF849 family)
MHLALDLIADGTLEGPAMWTFVLGVKYGFAATAQTLIYARDMLPRGAFWSAFGIGRMEFPIVAQAWLLGGHVRVGMEDNIYLEHGVLAQSNAQLVAKARDIIRSLGGAVATAAEARSMLNLPPSLRALRVAAAPPAGGNTGGPAEPVPRCSPTDLLAADGKGFE